MVYKWNISLLNYMEKQIRNFVWIGSVFLKKLIVVSWANCCCPKKEGCLGIENVCLLNEDMLSKLVASIHSPKFKVRFFFEMSLY